MELGFKNLDEKKQESAKKSFNFHKKARRFEDYALILYFTGFVAVTIWLGLKSISDRTYLTRFLQGLAFVIALLAIYFGWEHFLNWLFVTVFRSQNNEKLPNVSKRSLRNVLNAMNGNIGGLIWDVLWGCVLFSALVAGASVGSLTWENVSNIGGEMCLIYAGGYVLFRVIHKRRNLIKRMLKYTIEYYNYGNGKVYSEYVDWSLKENMLLCCKQYVLTKEFFMGYAHSDIWFYPVVIPRDFIAEAEIRGALYSDSRVTLSKAILACKLNNGKVIDFYLSRLNGSKMAIELLQKHGFEFTVRNDMVEYQ